MKKDLVEIDNLYMIGKIVERIVKFFGGVVVIKVWFYNNFFLFISYNM